MIDQPRFAEWVRLSHRANRIEPFMVVTIQGLGQLDAKLAAEDADFLVAPEDFQRSLQLTERFTRSYLWVLGAYELIRAIDQKCKVDPNLVSSQAAIEIASAKTQFERIRVPLAKFEAARKFSTTDSTVALPAIDRAKGIAWNVAPDTFISREDLAQCFRRVLEAL